MGGLSLAARQLGMRIALGVDISSTALRTFQKNFASAETLEGSVRSLKIGEQSIKSLKPWRFEPSPFIVVSGPPCQGFSAAGSRNAADPRNRVLGAVARLIVKLKPDCALLENVSMVLADKHSNRLSKLNETLKAGGYSVCHILADAAEFGVAQKRKRAFFLITKRKLDEQALMRGLCELKQPQTTVEAALRGLPTPSVRPDEYDDSSSFGDVANHLAMRHSQPVIDKIAALEPGKGPMSYRRLHPSRVSNTLFSGHRAPPSHFAEARSITVREAARLQGFPDDFRVYGSFANQMEQVTNAVPPPLARAVLRILMELTGLGIP